VRGFLALLFCLSLAFIPDYRLIPF
jgi:hypothetical protein